MTSQSLRRGTIRWPLLALGVALAFRCPAGEPTREPIIRVDNGSHSGPIFWAEPFAADSRIASVSYDKTLRIWRARDLKPLLTLRIPIEVERDGKLSFVAASPNGGQLAAGGWTCWDWEEKGCVYLFDAANGTLSKRLGGLPNIIGNLVYSPNGKVLAVGMHGNGGVAFIDMQTFTQVAEDREYAERVTGLAFSSNGYAVAGAVDGYLRVYDAEFKLAARAQIPEVKQIGAAYFSPDNRQLLIGAYDNPSLRILSFPELKVERVLTLPREKSLTSLRNAIWSRSGAFIYAIGDSGDTREARIFRWRADQTGDYQVIRIPTHRVQSIRPYGEHGLVFSTEDATLGIIDDAGRLARISQSNLAEFPQMHDAFRVSENGNTVSFPIDQSGGNTVSFEVRNLLLSSNRDQALTPAKPTQAKALKLTNWLNSSAPELNGVRLPLEPFEMARAYALAPDGKRLYLGTEWALRAYDRSGELLWRASMPGVVWNAAASADGRWVLAALSDGTVRWYRADDGKEALALFVDRRSQEWALWRPDGYYASSESGDNLIGWHVNRGKDNEPDFYRAVQFERQFYRPDLLRAELGGAENARNSLVAGRKSGATEVTTRHASVFPDRDAVAKPRVGEFSLSQLDSIAPPRIKITSARATSPAGLPELELTVAAEKNSLPMRDVNIYANLLPVATHQERQLDASESSRFRRTFRFPISAGDNLIRVEVNNGVSLGLAEQWFESPSAKSANPPKGDLYVLAVGVNQFGRISAEDKRNVPDLKYAVNDAVELAELLQKTAADSGFKQAHVRLLADSAEQQPTRQNILDALRFFEQAGPNDTVLLFLASHGFSDQTGNYYFLPQDGEFADIEAVLSGRNPTGKAPSLLSWTDFFDSMRQAAGRRVMIVDTCQAKNIFGEFDSRSLRKRSAAALFPLLLASKGDELSQEYKPARHGLFTHVLLEGLRGNADLNRDGNVTVLELHGYTVPWVDKLHAVSAGPQTPQLIAPGTLGNIALPSVDAKK